MLFLPLEKSEGFLLTDTAEIHFIELQKMYRQWKTGELQGSRDPLYRWFLLLMATEDEKISEELEEGHRGDGSSVSHVRMYFVLGPQGSVIIGQQRRRFFSGSGAGGSSIRARIFYYRF